MKANPVTTTKMLKIADIKAPPKLQLRADGTDQATIDDYAASMKAGEEFPPVTVFLDTEGQHWLGDGNHRYQAHVKLKRPEILAEIRTGTPRDAMLWAIEANIKQNAKRFTQADRRHAATALLRDKEFSAWSDRKIAKLVGVTHKTVGAARAELAGKPSKPRVSTPAPVSSQHNANITPRPVSNPDRPTVTVKNGQRHQRVAIAKGFEPLSEPAPGSTRAVQFEQDALVDKILRMVDGLDDYGHHRLRLFLARRPGYALTETPEVAPVEHPALSRLGSRCQARRPERSLMVAPGGLSMSEAFPDE